jgi:chloramphenicol 3-O phosphotransferase
MIHQCILLSVEPHPYPPGPGRAIFLNGASSSGKSTLAKALQRALEEPFLHVSSDQFVSAGMLPDRREDAGPFNWWNQLRPRFFSGFHRCLPALAEVTSKEVVYEQPPRDPFLQVKR